MSFFLFWKSSTFSNIFNNNLYNNFTDENTFIFISSQKLKLQSQWCLESKSRGSIKHDMISTFVLDGETEGKAR